MTSDPKRLQGVSAYHEIGSDLAKATRSFTAPVKDLGAANRDLASIVRLHGEMVTAKLDINDGEGREVSSAHARCDTSTAATPSTRTVSKASPQTCPGQPGQPHSRCGACGDISQLWAKD